MHRFRAPSLGSEDVGLKCGEAYRLYAYRHIPLVICQYTALCLVLYRQRLTMFRRTFVSRWPAEELPLIVEET